jgi:uncharacterized protein (TIGR03083 family)
MSGVEIAEHIAHLEDDGRALAAAATAAGWDKPVPSLEWTVRELVTHTGGVHRWAADIVANRRADLDTEAARSVGQGPGDAELHDWFVAGHADLVRTLSEAAADVECVAFLPAPSPLAFWARRQAHETAVHRADAESAAGGVTPFAPAFAQDGIAELLLGFAARRRRPLGRSATVALRASDGPSWHARIGGERVEASQGDNAAADLTVTGRSSDLYLWVWNRPSEAQVEGDPALAELWRESVRVRWG